MRMTKEEARGVLEIIGRDFSKSGHQCPNASTARLNSYTYYGNACATLSAEETDSALHRGYMIAENLRDGTSS